MSMKKIINIFWLSTLPIVAWSAEPEPITLVNPLSVDTPEALINNVIKAILGIVGAIALLYLIIGGLMWLTSQGNTEKVKKGKDTLVWAIAGLAMIFFSYVILSYVFTNFLS
jgi:hypothetical protein